MPRALSPEEFQDAGRDGLVVDVRPMDEYSSGHIRGSLSDAFRPSYATWLGWLAPEGARLFFVLGEAPLDAVIDESLLVGYEAFGGYLEGGVDAWQRAGLPVATTPVLDAVTTHTLIDGGAAVLDVREATEYESGHIAGAVNVPVGSLGANLDRVPRGRPVVAYCGMGERSTSAASILEGAGFEDVSNLAGGMITWRQAGMPVQA
jgi:hydroxyacylglutathione hydrolase